MDKKTLTGFVLIFLVLIVFNMTAINPDKTKVEETLPASGPESHEPAAEAYDEDFQDQKSEVLEAKIQEKITQTIENNVVKLEVVNIGGAIQGITLKQYRHAFPLSAFFAPNELNAQPYLFTEELRESDNGKELLAQYNNLSVRKIIDLGEKNQAKIKTYITNIGTSPVSHRFQIDNFKIQIEDVNEIIESARDKGFLEYSYSINNEITRVNNAFKFSARNDKTISGNINWLGFRDRYYAIVAKPKYDADTVRIESLDRKTLRMSILTGIINLDPGESVDFETSLYIGPQDMQKMADYDEGYEQITAFMSFAPLNYISKMIIRIMDFLHSFIPNWGICIIMIGLLVNGLMYPMTLKSMSSMKKMQSLQPELNKLKERYKNNPQRLNKEMMELYKEHQVNPLGGCLPMLLQLPIFFAIFQALWRTVHLKGAQFLWIEDLSMPDRLVLLPFKIPIINVEYINILPIIIIVLMSIQQKLSSKNMVATDPNQAAQQKMMTIFLPVFIGILFYNFASGMTLYFMTFYIFSITTQLKIAKMKI